MPLKTSQVPIVLLWEETVLPQFKYFSEIKDGNKVGWEIKYNGKPLFVRFTKK